MSERKIGLILSYLSLGIGNLISIVYTPVMLRLLGQGEYGLYNLIASIISNLGLLSFGFSSCYIYFYSRCKAKNDNEGVSRLNGMFLSIYVVISLLTLLVGAVLTLNSDIVLGAKLSASEQHTGKILMGILVLNMALSYPATIFNVYITAHEKFIFQKIVGIVSVVVNPLVVLPILVMGYGSVGMVVVTTSLSILVSISNALFCFRVLRIKFTFRGFQISQVKEMVIFTSFIFIGMLTDQINWSVDKYILGLTKGTSAVAVYSVGATLSRYYLAISASSLGVFTPMVNKMVAEHADDRMLTETFTKYGRLLFAVLSLICSGLIVFGSPFIRHWAGEEYAKSYPIMLLLVIPLSIPMIQGLGIAIQQAKNMHKFRSFTYLAIALVNVFISIPLAEKYGGVGCAIGTALALIVGNVFIMNWYYHKKIKLNVVYFWKEIFRFVPALVLPGLFGFWIMAQANIDHFLSLLFYISLYSICFCSSMWILGLNKYEKGLILKKVY